MAASPKVQLLTALISLFVPFLLSCSATDIHDLLPRYNLLEGLLLREVESYTLSDTDDSFTVELSSSPCYVRFGDQLIYYDNIIRGKLARGKVSDVSGIQAKKFFLWVPVTGIEVDEENQMIDFHVGALSQKLPAKDFVQLLTALISLFVPFLLSCSATDIHDLLPRYNLLEGLLLREVESYTLSDTDDSFTVELSSSPCYVRFGDQLVYYDNIIR
ncbi:hypothetical protein STAS_27989 [Striga asiatica]|uniref:Uncharacterized protein n=1 Tax=Striga asiatica TaxID=4170 RepID=A0A5A7R2Y9_STRAF|nr:hypothetical protein STAS_27989 [Striga asiatica]